MIRTFLAGVAALVALATLPAHAQQLPASAYPPGTQIVYTAHATNADVDETWGFLDPPVGTCVDTPTYPGTPLFHTISQDCLGRVDGSIQMGRLRRKIGTHSHVVDLVVLVSTYTPAPAGASFGASLALMDYGYSLEGLGFHRAKMALPVFAPDGADALSAVHYASGWGALALGYASGTTEVEALAMWKTKFPADKKAAVAALAAQVKMVQP